MNIILLVIRMNRVRNKTAKLPNVSATVWKWSGAHWRIMGCVLALAAKTQVCESLSEQAKIDCKCARLKENYATTRPGKRRKEDMKKSVWSRVSGAALCLTSRQKSVVSAQEEVVIIETTTANDWQLQSSDPFKDYTQGFLQNFHKKLSCSL